MAHLHRLSMAAFTPEMRDESLKKARNAKRTLLPEDYQMKAKPGAMNPDPVGWFSQCSRCGKVHHTYESKPVKRHWKCPTGPLKAGRLRSHKSLKISYGLFVAHVLQGKPISLSANEDGELGLAAKYGLTPETCYRRIRDFRKLIPTDANGSQLIRTLIKALHWVEDNSSESKTDRVTTEIAQLESAEPEHDPEVEEKEEKGPGMALAVNLREILDHCFADGPKSVDQLEQMTGRPRKRIMNALNIHQSKYFVKLPSTYRNALWGRKETV